MKHTIADYQKFISKASLALHVPCVLAGGAVRDVLLNRTDKINDLDVWIHAPDLITVRERAERSGFFGTLKRRIGNAHAHLGRNGAIIAIDYFDLDGQEINLIYMKEPTPLLDLLNDFDFGINQAGICPYRGLKVTGEFLYAKDYKVLKVTRKDDSERSAQRLLKMREKFPEWAVEDDLPVPSVPKVPLNFGASSSIIT